MEHVNHPPHYNKHPNGIECIDVIRHYTCDIANAIKYLWRAGLKQDADKTAIDKELEDLSKALWYINDYIDMCDTKGCQHRQLGCAVCAVLLRLTGHSIFDVTRGYDDNISEAIAGLMRVGIVSEHTVYAVVEWRYWLEYSTKHINQRINFLKSIESNTQNLPPEFY